MTIITSFSELSAFLQEKGVTLEIRDDLKWTCPACGGVNYGAYVSHEVPCTHCQKFSFPKLNRDPRVEQPPQEYIRIKETTDRIDELAFQISEYEGRIKNLEDEACGLEGAVYEFRKTLKVEKAHLKTLQKGAPKTKEGGDDE